MRASVLLAPHLDKRQRADWASAVVADLDTEPYQLVLEGIAQARRSCRHPADFVPTVISYVVSRKARLEAEAARLEQLRESIA